MCLTARLSPSSAEISSRENTSASAREKTGEGLGRIRIGANGKIENSGAAKNDSFELLEITSTRKTRRMQSSVSSSDISADAAWADRPRKEVIMQRKCHTYAKPC